MEMTIGHLLGVNTGNNVPKDPAMLKRLNEISKFTEKEREYILYTIDALITKAKLKSITD
jgi:hypothetical protein